MLQGFCYTACLGCEHPLDFDKSVFSWDLQCKSGQFSRYASQLQVNVHRALVGSKLPGWYGISPAPLHSVARPPLFYFHPPTDHLPLLSAWLALLHPTPPKPARNGNGILVGCEFLLPSVLCPSVCYRAVTPEDMAYIAVAVLLTSSASASRTPQVNPCLDPFVGKGLVQLREWQGRMQKICLPHVGQETAESLKNNTQPLLRRHEATINATCSKSCGGRAFGSFEVGLQDSWVLWECTRKCRLLASTGCWRVLLLLLLLLHYCNYYYCYYYYYYYYY